ncbi:MAG: CoA transferase [Pseudomonadota bacterium]
MLKPYTVLDFTDERGEIGPMLLGDLGADVIRVEAPGGSAARRGTQTIKGADDDLQSLRFVAFNRNKRSIVLDPADAADKAALTELVRRADIVFESGNNLAAYGLDFEVLEQINARIVHVRISAFGSTGPYADYLGNDLVIAAMGGPVSLQGVPERAPLRISVPQVWRHTGAEAAAGAMVAHRKMLADGTAKFVDLSAQSVMTWTMLNAMDAYAIQGYDFERGGSTLNNGTLLVQLVHPTADGHVVALPMSRVIVPCLDWMISEGLASNTLHDLDWEEYDLCLGTPGEGPMELEEGTALLRSFLIRRTNAELFEFGIRNGVSFAPVNTLQELLTLGHMHLRGYWEDVALPDGKTIHAPGLWCKPTVGELGIKHPAPGLDQHGATIRAELEQPAAPKEHPEPSGDSLPFAGLKVTDFAWVGVGPISSKYLADHGADVVRIESESRPDVLRAGGPFKDNEPGINRSQFYGDFNTSKKSIALDMKSPDAIALAKKLIVESDVMIESFAPGAIGRMGLGYEEVRKLNPGLIMISTCLMGQTGPAANLAGYGYHAAAIAGFYEVTGWPDMAPLGPWLAYTDTIAPRFISTLLAAALDHRRRTGEGCYIDVAQIETALHFLAPEFLDLQANGVDSERIGNRAPDLAPQGCYPCAGEDQWCAIAIDTDAQWQTLCATIGADALGADANLSGHAGRLARHDEIDAVISAWTHRHSPEAVMHTLQAAGVPAGKVQRSSDLLADPQYSHRDFYRYHTHGEMGHIPYAGHQYQISGYAHGPRGPAPMLGEHSFEILSGRLKMSDEDIAGVYASGVIT